MILRFIGLRRYWHLGRCQQFFQASYRHQGLESQKHFCCVECDMPRHLFCCKWCSTWTSKDCVSCSWKIWHPMLHTHRLYWWSCRLLPHRALGTCTGSQIPYTVWLQGEKITGKCLYISYNKACDHRLGWWVHSTSTEYKSEATYNHGSPVKWSAHVCTPWKGLLASGRARGRSRTREKGSPGHGAHCRAPSRNAASSHGQAERCPQL